MSELISVVITGEVDHGKSSLVGKLLEETGAISISRIEAVQKICKAKNKEYEPAFLLDSFEEEQHQGITIDISQINFATAQRQFRLIDSPGHRDFLKNMVSGSSVADAAVLLIDAKEGIREQSRRHCSLLKLLGIDSILVVVNKMDLINYAEKSFRAICEECSRFLNELGIKVIYYIPVSAKYGVNIAKQGGEMPWYKGPSALTALDSLPLRASVSQSPLRFPIQDVYKFEDRRVLVGRIESGSLRVGDELKAWPLGQSAKVASIERWSSPQSKQAQAGESIGITLQEQVFVERGHIFADATDSASVSDRIEANIFWMGRERVSVGSKLQLKLLTQDVDCEIISVDGIIDASSLKRDVSPRSFVECNEVAMVTIKTYRPIVADSFKQIRSSGRFVLVREGRVSGGGIVAQALRRESDRKQSLEKKHYLQESALRSLLKAASWRIGGILCTVLLVKFITKSSKLALEIGSLEAVLKIGLYFLHERIWNRISIGRKEAKPVVIWFTGLPCAGKSTISEELCRVLRKAGHAVEHLDGDAVREIFPTTGFSREERNSHIERVGFLASKLVKNGVFVIASFVSPYAESRDFVRKLCGDFVEVYVSTPLHVCEERDVKGMYAKARRNEISNFTGVSAPYEVPVLAELSVDASQKSVKDCVDEVMNYLSAQDPNIMRANK